MTALIRKDRKVDFNRCFFAMTCWDKRKNCSFILFKGETYEGSNKIFRLFFFFFFFVRIVFEFLVVIFLLHLLFRIIRRGYVFSIFFSLYHIYDWIGNEHWFSVKRNTNFPSCKIIIGKMLINSRINVCKFDIIVSCFTRDAKLSRK